MVGRRELETSVLCTRIDNYIAFVVEEVARRKTFSVSRLLSERIHDGIEKELGPKTDTEILRWTQDFVLKKAIALRR